MSRNRNQNYNHQNNYDDNYDDSSLTLLAWTLKNKYLIKSSESRGSSDSEKYTHLKLDGGILRIPDTQYQTFLEKYGNDIGNKIVHGLSEQRSSVYRFNVDLDMKSDRAVGPEEIKSLVALFQDCIHRFFPNMDATARTKTLICGVYIAEVTTIMSHGTMIKKSGVHLYFYSLLVDNHMARMIRESFVAACYLKFGDRDAVMGNSWEDVIDENIYISNGLRMPYSHKFTDCPRCHNRKEQRQTCYECVGIQKSMGKKDEGRPYIPQIVYDGYANVHKDLTSRMTNNIHFAISFGSIRCSEGTPVTAGFVEYVGAPQYVSVRDLEAIKKKKQKNPNVDIPAGTHYEDSNMSGKAKSGFIIIDKHQPHFTKLLTYITSFFNPEKYCNLVGSRLSVNNARDKYWFYVKGEGSQYCANIDGCHRSNSIHFVITKGGVAQRCGCKCEDLTGRKFGLCKKFESAKIPIPTDLEKLLFGEANTIALELYRNPVTLEKKEDWSRAIMMRMKHMAGLRTGDVSELNFKKRSHPSKNDSAASSSSDGIASKKRRTE